MHHANPRGQFVNLRVRPRPARADTSNQNAGLKAPATAEGVARTDELNLDRRAAVVVIDGRLLL
jgi:hypothetical protein